MKVYRKIIISICVVMAIFLTAALCINHPGLKTIVTGSYPSQEEYSSWEEYSAEVAKSLNNEIIEDKEVRASHNITNNLITVEIYSIKYGITIEAKYPVEYINNQNEKTEIQIDYENAKYAKYFARMRNIGSENKVFVFIIIFLLLCLCGAIFAFLAIYPIFYGIPKVIYCIIQFIKSKKKTE